MTDEYRKGAEVMREACVQELAKLLDTLAIEIEQEDSRRRLKKLKRRYSGILEARMYIRALKTEKVLK